MWPVDASLMKNATKLEHNKQWLTSFITSFIIRMKESISISIKMSSHLHYDYWNWSISGHVPPTNAFSSNFRLSQTRIAFFLSLSLSFFLQGMNMPCMVILWCVSCVFSPACSQVQCSIDHCNNIRVYHRNYCLEILYTNKPLNEQHNIFLSVVIYYSASVPHVFCATETIKYISGYPNSKWIVPTQYIYWKIIKERETERVVKMWKSMI